MKRHILFVLCILCSTTGVFAQSIQLVDASTLEPVAGAKLKVQHTGKIESISDNKGMLWLNPFDRDATLILMADGYEYFVARKSEIPAVVQMHPTSILYSPITISANKIEEEMRTSPRQTLAIDRKTISFFNQQTSADLLQQTGQVLVQKSQQGGGSPILRGFEANRVLLVVDGVRMNNAIYRAGHLQNIITLDQYNQERVEVSFGAGSVLYGSDALGGAICFYSKSPKFSNSDTVLVTGQVFRRYSSANNERMEHAEVSLGGKRLASFTSVTSSQFDDLRAGDLRTNGYDWFGRRYWYVQRYGDKDSVMVNNNPNIQVGSAYRQIDVGQKLVYLSKAGLRHILNFQYSNSSDVPRYDRLTEWSGNNPSHAEWYYGPQQRLFGNYQLVWNGFAKWAEHVRFSAAVQRIDETRNSRGFGSTRLSRREERVDAINLNLDLMKDFGAHQIMYGGEFWTNNVRSNAFRINKLTQETTFLNTRYPDGGSTMNSTAIYLTDKITLNKSWTLSAGMRFTASALEARIDSTDLNVQVVNGADTSIVYFLNGVELKQSNAIANGQLGIVYSPNENFKWSALASTGFRAPNVDDVGKLFDPAPGTIIVPNPELKPEYATSIETGAEVFVKRTVRIQANAYFTWLKDAITIDKASFLAPNGLVYDDVLKTPVTNVNADRAEVWGISGSVYAELAPWATLFSTIAYTKGTLFMPNGSTPLDHIPPTYGRTGVQFSANKFRAEVWSLYNGWKRIADYRLDAEDNEVYATPEGMPAWYTLNARAQYQLNSMWQVQLACENIMNVHYRVFASGISGAGRSAILSIRLSF
jgi:hemoglobin/transferrin/lactoferrin receptor protein